MSTSYTDIAAWNAATNQATARSQSEYQKAQAQGLGEQAALDKAKFAWQQTMDQAGLTGQYQGQWTMPSNEFFANTFGSWGAPQAGQQTLAGQQQQWQQAYNNSMAYGQYYAPGTTPDAGAQTLQAQNQAQQLGLSQAGLTGYYNAPGSAPGSQGTQTLAGQQQQWQQGFSQEQFAAQQQQLQQQNAQAYLSQLAQLRGPADWAKYQQVLGSTPNGMRDLAAAAMGQYTPGGGATTGMNPQAVNLNTMQQQIAGQGGYGGYTGQGQQNWAQQQAAAQQNPQWQQAAQGQYGQLNRQAGAGMQQAPMQQMAMQGGDPGLQAQMQLQAQGGYQWGQGGGSYGTPGRSAAPQQAWGTGIGIGGQGATPDQQQQGQGNGTNMYGASGQGQNQYNLPAPNQIAAQSWNNMAPSQQQMLLGQYEANGWDKGDVTALYNQSLPKYGSNAPSAGTWRLQ